MDGRRRGVPVGDRGRANTDPTARQRTRRRADGRRVRNEDRPLLAANCYACHGEAARAGLRLDSREGMLKGGDTGPVIVPGKPEESTLIKAVQHTDGYPKMPRGRAKLQQADIDVLVEWVRGGAAWPASAERCPHPWHRTSV